ncbi:endopeptidase La [Gammaproteobacteria bacterium]|nr:endopeptidase La [Gammaproteobacteria bacterium]
MTDTSPKTYPVLPLRDVVVFPGMVVPLFVGRERSLRALERAGDTDKELVLLSQFDASDDDPPPERLHSTGTRVSVLQMLRLPDNTVKLLVEGQGRFRVDQFVSSDPCYLVEGSPLADEVDQADTIECDVLMRTVRAEFESYARANGKIASEVTTSLSDYSEPGRLADAIAGHVILKLEQKQEILEMLSPISRLEHVLGVMGAEIDIMELEKKIRSRVKKQMERSQRDYYLNEQMKAIQREIGEGEEGAGEFDEIADKIETAKMPSHAREKAETEFKKLRMMPAMSAEATVVRNYIDWLTQMPWTKRSRVRSDLAEAQAVLDEDHYGLEEVKDRVLDYLAVQKRTRKVRGAILCLVGPPGVGKTSLGRSIARATNRKFARVALGGVRDEAEIRGHRRTYIGSMPGKIVQNLTRVKTRNPLLMLDEVDKLSNDFRGDPASALLEVLDPEQNSAFVDHYLDVEYDLSDVMFIATANTLDIPAPLLDRMEVIRLSGYTEDEKVAIARNYLVPKQAKANGLKPDELQLDDDLILDTIRYYTREAGVRNLERQIGRICRKAVRRLLEHSDCKSVVVNTQLHAEFLGTRRYRYGESGKENRVGVVTGLAWTEVGGEMLMVEVVNVPGKGRHQLTGKLGDVMKESIQTAITVVRHRSERFEIAPALFQERDFHIHVPEGATPKDGPSAGIAMVTGILSSATNVAVRADVAMTGEVTLTGEVLAIGGLKEKLLAASRGGIRKVLIPKDNEKDLADVPEKILNALEIVPVETIDDVLPHALESVPGGDVTKKIVPVASDTARDDAAPLRH